MLSLRLFSSKDDPARLPFELRIDGRPLTADFTSADWGPFQSIWFDAAPDAALLDVRVGQLVGSWQDTYVGWEWDGKQPRLADRLLPDRPELFLSLAGQQAQMRLTYLQKLGPRNETGAYWRTRSFPPGWSARLVAVDDAGVVHPPSSERTPLRDAARAGNSEDDYAEFYPLDLSRIKAVRFQVRRCQWIEVRNISLQPGRHSQVEVVEALVPDAAASAGQPTMSLPSSAVSHGPVPVPARPGANAGEVLILTPPDEASVILPYRFSWRPIEGTRLYAVRISEIRGKKPVFVKETTGTEMMIEPSELKAGKNYSWQVEAIDATGRTAGATEGRYGRTINCFSVADDQGKPTRHNGKRVLLDFSHHESDIHGLGVYNFSQYTAYRLLQGEGCEVATNTDRHLLHDYLKDYGLLILHSKYAGPIRPFIPSEIAGITDFVSEGGKLFVACSGSGGGADHPDFYNPLLRAFGLEVGNIDKPDFHEATLTMDDSSQENMRIVLQCPAEIIGTNYTVLAAAPSGKPVIVKRNIGKGLVVVSGAGMAFQDCMMARDREEAAGNRKAFLALINSLLREAQSVTRIAAGNHHSLFVKNDGSLWTMGWNNYGQLGNGTTNSISRPMQIVAGGVTAISAGARHSLFLKSDGSLWGMGEDWPGYLVDGTYQYSSRPQMIVASDVTAITGGWGHNLLLKSDGSLWGMGWNNYGQLGNGNCGTLPYHGTKTPEKIVASGVTAMAGGWGHSLFVKSDGSLWGMGYNADGQLGDATAEPYPDCPTNSVTRPQKIDASNVTAVAAGNLYSLFVKSGGSVWAMGLKSSGATSPKQIMASNVTAIATGNGHSLFVKSDGSLWVLGGNQYGQLGDATTNYIDHPKQIVANNVTAVAAGISHSLFLKRDGSLWVMGDNRFGQLGDGTTNNIIRPKQIVGGQRASAAPSQH